MVLPAPYIKVLLARFKRSGLILLTDGIPALEVFADSADKKRA